MTSLFCDDLGCLDNGGRIHKVLRIHEFLPRRFDAFGQIINGEKKLLIHALFGNGIANRGNIIRFAEVSRQRFFADDMLSCIQGLFYHIRMNIRRGTDIDHVDFRIVQQIIEVKGCLFKSVPFLCHIYFLRAQ
ncbi:hypothetical protein SDC9_126357 [bioreactor metagenome]|uniref:Uncharacterized protein n=1 Tax=bioreactor metagenome TaxID=1076179 RepID=A0A645CR10_9ZZZZ